MTGQPTPAAESETDPVKETVLQIIAEKTGYPSDMLDLDLSTAKKTARNVAAQTTILTPTMKFRIIYVLSQKTTES